MMAHDFQIVASMFARSIYVKRILRMMPVSKCSETPLQRTHLQWSDLYNEELTTSRQDILYVYYECKCCASAAVVASAGCSSLLMWRAVAALLHGVCSNATNQPLGTPNFIRCSNVCCTRGLLQRSVIPSDKVCTKKFAS